MFYRVKLLPLFAAALACVSAVTAFATDSTVIFNEIHYNPIGGQQEFIELRNLNAVDVAIGGWKISGGVDYTFPATTVVPGGGYVLLGAVAGASGNFSGQLSNSGELLQLRNQNGRLMDELNYADSGDWPLGADGTGATLSRRGVTASQDPSVWAASTQIGGTPGAQNFYEPTSTAIAAPAAAPTLIFNEISSAIDPTGFVEIKNVSAATVSSAGWTLATTAGQSISLPTVSVPAGSFASFTFTTLGLTPAVSLKMWLLAPGGTLLSDTRDMSNRLRGLTADGRWGYPDAPTPGTANTFTISNAIVINEIFYHGLSNSPEQWIELTNRSNAAVDVSGWKFTKGVSFTIPAATPKIVPGGFLVVAWDPAAFHTLHPAVTALGPWSGSLSGKGETITLSDANDNVVNEVPYFDGGRWSQWADGGGSSLELRDARADNSKGEAWDASDESAQAPWVTVASGTYQGLGALSNADNPTNFNEFVFGLLDSGEFLIDDISVKDVSLGNVELIQNGGFESGTATAWRIIGTHSGTVITDPVSGTGKVLKVSATHGTEHMHNHAETTLKNGGTYVSLDATHTYNITFRAKWLRGGNRLNTRLWFNRLPRQTLLPIPVTGGTPGAPNGKAVANIGPTFDAMSHSPVIPAAGQVATVSIQVADPDGIGSAQLLYSANGAAFTSVAMTTTGGGVYTGNVPGQGSSALVQFYVQATDLLGAVSTFPAAGAASRAMIPWQDGRAQLTLASGAKPHNIRVVLPTADATELYKPENLMSDNAIPGTVILDESEVFYRAGIRLKSSEHGRVTDARCGYTLEFPSDQHFMGLHDTLSIDRSGGTAATIGVSPGQKEILLRRLINAAGGIYAAEDDLCRVISAVGTMPTSQYFSGANMTSAAILSKTRLDSEYLADQFVNGADGEMNKYELIYVQTQTINPGTRTIATPTFGTSGTILSAIAEDPKVPQSSPGPKAGVTVSTLGADKEAYRWYWLTQNAGSADNYAGIINLTNVLGQLNTSNNTPAAFTAVDQAIDVNGWLRACVPAILYGVQDNYLGTGSHHNTLIYFPPGQKAVLMPWDMDYLLTSSTTSLTSGGDVQKFITNPIWKRLYYGHMFDILNRSFNTTYMTTWAAHYTKFSTDDISSWVSSFLTPRAAYASSQLTAQIAFAPFARTSASPVTVSTPFATVTGNGWVNLSDIRLQGSALPLAITWTGESTWTVQLPIAAGTNTYTLIPYDKYGVQLTTAMSGGSPASATVTVTGSGGIFPASAGSLVVSELNYNPPGPTDDTEFIELLNITTATLDLSGCHFDEEAGQGIAYTFPSNIQLAPGARIVVVRNTSLFTSMYGAAPRVAPGVFTGALDNSGESIVLYSAAGLEIFRFTYNDSITSTDGGGRTLVRVLSSTNPNPSSYTWRESTQINGNPGAGDSVNFTGSALADVDGDGYAALVEYACGTSDNSAASVPSAPQFVFNGDGTVSVSYAVLPNADDAICTVETTATLGSGWVPVTSPVPFSPPRFFRLSVRPR